MCFLELCSNGAFKQRDFRIYSVERRVAETLKWIFIGEIPLLCEAKRVARQLEIEMWLDPSPLLNTLNLKPVCQAKPNKSEYVT